MTKEYEEDNFKWLETLDTNEDTRKLLTRVLYIEGFFFAAKDKKKELMLSLGKKCECGKEVVTQLNWDDVCGIIDHMSEWLMSLGDKND